MDWCKLFIVIENFRLDKTKRTFLRRWWSNVLFNFYSEQREQCWPKLAIRNKEKVQRPLNYLEGGESEERNRNPGPVFSIKYKLS